MQMPKLPPLEAHFAKDRPWVKLLALVIVLSPLVLDRLSKVVAESRKVTSSLRRARLPN